MKLLRKKINFRIVLLIIIGLVSSCTYINDFNCIEGVGPVVTENLPIKNFNTVLLKINAKVNVYQGKEPKFRIDAPDNLLKAIQVNVTEKSLKIFSEKCLESNNQVLISIQSPNYKELSINGSGKFENSNVLESSSLIASISGSGSMNLNLKVKELNTDIAGSGNMSLFGTADKHVSEIAGSGDITARDLITKQTKITIDGSGDMDVEVVNSLDVDISGSGDVIYGGQPQLSVRTSGSGTVKARKSI